LNIKNYRAVTKTVKL